MISVIEKEKILKVAEKYTFTHLYLFGSAARSVDNYRDVDLAVEGLNSSDYFSFYGDLILSVDHPVDLIDLSEDSLFNRIVKEEGILLV